MGHCPGEGLYPDLDNCQCYWNCAHHVAFHTCCGVGTLYDAVNMDCDYPDHVDCGDRPLPGSTRPPSTTKSTTTSTTPSTTTSTTTTTTTTTTSTTTTTTTTT